MYASITVHEIPVTDEHPCRQTDGLSDNVFLSEVASICSLVSRQFASISPPERFDSDGNPVVCGLSICCVFCLGNTHFLIIQHSEDVRVQAMADRIVDYARVCMANKKRISPFERAAAREGLYYRGGVSLRQYIFEGFSLTVPLTFLESG